MNAIHNNTGRTHHPNSHGDNYLEAGLRKSLIRPIDSLNSSGLKP